MELFTAIVNPKEFFLDNMRFSMFVPLVTRHTSIRYSCTCYTRINMCVSVFFTAAKIRVFRTARSRGNRGTNTRSLTLHKMHNAQ